MGIFLDTGVLVAVRNADDNRHERSNNLMEKALKDDFGTIYTSDYIIDEATTLALVRTDDPKLAIDVGKYTIDSPRIKILKISRKDFQATWEKFKSLSDEGLSFTDCSTLHLMEENRIDKIMSYDSGFDGFKKRIC
ncbi:hypothetical protein AKJ52_00575 [candidate division MSBL1 archaeon SCGC-AAA382C18]|uniref:PIN domain-containing protein n=1 Tax=candidate division MSBL1 archaeon SCGC-AAA382C18 TaxID=1698281 RepID=A0A133VLI7_9EURY|nr:hypothetical protein AKJ52_00575 [candidate division MSBL1 archaeon SCGC-AAA382C18]